MDIPDWLQIIIRSVSLVIVLYLLTKWLGKKHILQLTYFDYIVGIIVGTIIAEIATSPQSSLFQGLYSVIIWLAIPFVVGLMTVKNKKLRTWFNGEPVEVIKEGKIQEEALQKEKLSADDLLQQLRKKNVFNVTDVEFAVLETTGEINTLLKKEKQTITNADLKIAVAPTRPAETVIEEGKIADQALANCGYTRKWLLVELEKLNIALDNVYLAQIDEKGQLIVDVYDDKIQIPEPQETTLLLTALKKCHADLELFSLNTDCPKSKQMYKKHAEKVQKMIQQTAHLLT